MNETLVNMFMQEAMSAAEEATQRFRGLEGYVILYTQTLDESFSVAQSKKAKDMIAHAIDEYLASEGDDRHVKQNGVCLYLERG